MQDILAAGQAVMSQWAIADAVRETVWVKALLESVHILAMGFVLFAVGMIAVRFSGAGRQSGTMAEVVRRFTPWVWGALAVVLVTGGVLLTGAGRQRGLPSPMFQLKMVLMIVSVLVTAALQVTLQNGRSFWDVQPWRQAAVRVMAPLCFLLWIATVCAGRWLAYGYILFPNG